MPQENNIYNSIRYEIADLGLSAPQVSGIMINTSPTYGRYQEYLVMIDRYNGGVSVKKKSITNSSGIFRII